MCKLIDFTLENDNIIADRKYYNITNKLIIKYHPEFLTKFKREDARDTEFRCTTKQNIMTVFSDG